MMTHRVPDGGDLIPLLHPTIPVSMSIWNLIYPTSPRAAAAPPSALLPQQLGYPSHYGQSGFEWIWPSNCCRRARRDGRRGMDKSVNEPKSSLATVKHISFILHSMWAWFVHGRRWDWKEVEGSKDLFIQLLKISPLVNVVRWPMPVSFSLIPPILNSLNIS